MSDNKGMYKDKKTDYQDPEFSTGKRYFDITKWFATLPY